MTTSTRCHVYCRVSSQGQEDNHSLDTQEAACRAWAKERGLTIASMAREVWSGADRHRPELDALLDRLLPGDIVIAYDLDRLSRGGIVDIAIIVDQIESAGASAEFVNQSFEQTETGVLLRSVRAYAAAIEREQITERTQRGKRARVVSGKPLVGKTAPFGYAWADEAKSRLIVDPETSPVVRRIYDLALSGMSLRGICTILERDAIPSPGGKMRWTATGVRHILIRPTYSGTAVSYRHRHERKPDGTYAVRGASDAEMVALPGIAPALVTPEEQATILTRLEANQAHATRNNRMPERSLLRCGIARCGVCGRAMAVKNPYPSRPDGPPRYFCKHAECGRPSIATTMIDGVVWERVSEVLRNPAIIAREVARHRNSGGLERDLAANEKRLAALVERHDNGTKRLMIVDDDTAERLSVELKALSAERKAAQDERDNLQRRIADQREEDQRVRNLAEWAETVSANLESLTYGEKRLALDAFGATVHVFRPGAVDTEGQPLPRWELTLDPGIVTEPSLALRSTHRTRETSFSPAASSP